MTRSLPNRPRRLHRTIIALAAGALVVLSGASPASATVPTSTTNQGGPSSPSSPADAARDGAATTPTGAATPGKAEPAPLPQLDADGVPYMETIKAADYISADLVAQFAASGELKSAFVDDAQKMGSVLTNGGVVMAFSYDAQPELLEALIAAGVPPTFVSFSAAPVAEIERIAQKKADREIWTKMLPLLPFLILIGGACVIYDLRQRRMRKPELKDDETSFQTREGPAGTIPKVTFADVAGCEEAIEDLSEIVEFLKDPERFERLGAKIPRGAILVGPPGTGKTLLARAVAGEAKVEFFAASGSDFVEMYVGVGPMRVRELFTKARAAEKAIIFIDEIDAVARSRVMSTKQNANDERENTLNALLHELDGFSRSNVILLAATNRVDILDPAILRPGRLDRKVQVPNPDRRGRENILAVHTTGKPLAKDVDLGAIAKRTPGMSGADLAQIANEAAIEGARRNLKAIDASCFSAAVALVAMGRARRSALVTDRDRLITAYHEAGHTLCALVHPDAANPAGVSITPRGHAGGITWMNGTDDQYMARTQAAAQLVVALGGRAGEELLLDGEFTQGPSSDLEKATQLATVMVTRYGMTRRGLAVRAGEPDTVSHDVIEELLASALEDARAMLQEHSTLFHAIVSQLLEHETLESGELDDLVESVRSGAIFTGPNPLHRAGHAAVEAVSAVGHVIGAAVEKAQRGTRRGRDATAPSVTATQPSTPRVRRKAVPVSDGASEAVPAPTPSPESTGTVPTLAGRSSRATTRGAVGATKNAQGGATERSRRSTGAKPTGSKTAGAKTSRRRTPVVEGGQS